MKMISKPTVITSIVLYLAIVATVLSLLASASSAQAADYPIVDTGQTTCYDDSGAATACPAEGEAFYGQDAQFTGNAPSYTDNPSTGSGQAGSGQAGDGTVTDNVTGLIWRQSTDTDGDGDIDYDDEMTYADAVTYCENLAYAGTDDWTLPTIKQLYSLIDFSGVDPSGYRGENTSGLVPFIDTDYFDFAYGDTNANERIIDSQYASSSLYVGDTRMPLLFGVNFADGRIKGYGLGFAGREKTFSVACMRENSSYGANDFVDNGDSTIIDSATGLMWAQDDSGSDVPAGLNWEEALAYVEAMNQVSYLGYSDWRLPNVKELQSIVDYSRSPDSTDSAAIDPLFNATAIINEAGETDYAFYWSSTTHSNWTKKPGRAATYVSFGRGLGYMNGVWSDVHGAGSQRSDPKVGDPDDYPTGNGPQGDAVRIYNYVRLVRDVDDVQTSELSRFTVSPVIRTADVIEAAVQGAAVAPHAASAPLLAPEAGEPTDRGQRPDLAAAVSQLGVTEEALRAALGDPGQGPPDFAAVAAELGVTEEALIKALGLTTGGPPMGGPTNGQQPSGGQPSMGDRPGRRGRP